jgi:predicted nucleic acid-binding protein
MVTAYPDTSFLFNLYAPKAHTARASAHFAAMKGPLQMTSLNHFEITNAIQLALFRKTILRSHAQAAFAAMEDDLATGATELVSCDWGAVHGRALRIARQHTAKGGNRGLDILHVATALELGAKEFLTFDSRQGVLAKAVGLKVKPVI